jgi:DNA-binding transcriptional regulator LsrR (DeoR family)
MPQTPYDDSIKAAVAMMAELVADNRGSKYKSRYLKQAAADLGLSEDQFTRILRAARSEGKLRERFDPASVSEAALDDARKILEASLMRTAIQRLAPASAAGRKLRVIIASSRDTSIGDQDIDSRMRTFARNSAEALKAMLIDSSGVGIVALAFGTMVKALVDGLFDNASMPRIQHCPKVIPTMGEPLMKNSSELSSTVLSQRLARFLGRGDFYSLNLILAYLPDIPNDLGREDRNAFFKYLSRLPDYDLIFNDRSGLIWQVDLLLTSISSEVPFGYGNEGRFLQTDFGVEQLKELFAFDIGGVGIPRDGLSPAMTEKLRLFAENSTCLREEHLRAISARARKNPASYGVVLAAIGENKAANVARAIELGYCDTLLCDFELATELLRHAVRSGKFFPGERKDDVDRLLGLDQP